MEAKNVNADILQRIKIVEEILLKLDSNIDATFKFKYKIPSKKDRLRSMTIRLNEKGNISFELTGNGPPLEFFCVNPKGEHFEKILNCIKSHMT
jgi:hypothetical protein